MELTEKEKHEIAQMVANILAGKNKKKINHSWLTLSKEIEDYCKADSKVVRWPTMQTKIYDTIRVCLNISRIDDMSNEQVIRARSIFEFIKEERRKNDEQLTILQFRRE